MDSQLDSPVDSPPPTPSQGRRRFDRDTALRKAMEFFWTHGYETSSMADLLKAMDLKAPSLYAAFGNKERLFFETVELYAATYSVLLYQPLDELISARDAIEKMLLNAAEIFSTPGHPAGCFLVSSAATCSEGAAYVRQEMQKRRAEKEKVICRRLERAIVDGELSATAYPPHLAKFFNTVMQGISTQSRDGASPEELRAVAESAMAVWPSDR